MDTIWILSSQLATDFGTTLVCSNVSLQRPDGTNNRIICAKQETQKSPFITTGHVCLASCWWWLAKKMSKRFERKLGFAEKKCLERNQFYLKWLFNVIQRWWFSLHPIRKKNPPKLNKSKAKMMLAFKKKPQRLDSTRLFVSRRCWFTVDPVAIQIGHRVERSNGPATTQPFYLGSRFGGMHDLKVLKGKQGKRFAECISRFFKVVSLLQMYIQFYKHTI